MAQEPAAVMPAPTAVPTEAAYDAEPQLLTVTKGLQALGHQVQARVGVVVTAVPHSDLLVLRLLLVLVALLLVPGHSAPDDLP